MSFPFTFAQRSGDYDFVSPIINFTGNAAIVAVGAFSLAAITSIALKALGFSNWATSLATAIPVTIGAFGVAATIVGASLLIAIMIALVKALARR